MSVVGGSRSGRARSVGGAILLILGLLAAGPAAADRSAEADGISAPASGDLVLTGPSTAAPNSGIEVVIEAPAGATAYEAVLDFDANAVEFGGFYQSSDTTVVTMATVQPGHVAVLAHRCHDDSCDTGLTAGLGRITARFSIQEPGSHRIGLSGGVFTSNDGSAVETAATSLTVTAETGPTTQGPAEALGLADRSPVVAGQISGDVSGEGRINGMDVVDAAHAWAEVRRVGAPCSLSTSRLEAVDADGSGCIDVVDVAAIAAAVAAAAPDEGAVVAPSSGATNSAIAAPFVVNTTSDQGDNNLNDGVCGTSSNTCSLRAAIQQANANVGPDTINFNIPGNGPHRISLGSNLPGVGDATGGVTIDGYTQPGASVNTSETVFNANIRIEVDGPSDTSGVSLSFYSANNTVRGLAMYGSYWNIHLSGGGSVNNRVVGNIIGTNIAATIDPTSGSADQSGIEIGSQSSDNRIGTPALADRNVISGNYYSGVRINHAGTRGNIIQNNMIGLRPDGNDSLYTDRTGVDVQWGALETMIGGYQRNAGNVITGVRRYGVDLSHSSKNNFVVGNFIGTDATGNQIPSHAANDVGIAIKDNTVGNRIEQNVIGGNRLYGVWHRHNFTGENFFRYNRIGVGYDGGDIGNRGMGVHLTGHDTTYTGNIIANNDDDGIEINNFNGGNGFSPPEYTERNDLSRNSFYNNDGLGVDLRDGVNNGVGTPSISSAGGGAASGTACGNCLVELYAAPGGEARVFLAETTAAGNGSWTITDSRIDNMRLRAQATTGNDDSSEFSAIFDTGSPSDSSAPTINPIPDQSGLQFGLKTIQVEAQDPDGNPLGFSAIGLPEGVNIDPVTGIISGRPGSIGGHDVLVRVDDGYRTAQRSFVWTVSEVNTAPTISLPQARQLVDDFESGQGWQVDPNGTDDATTGQWEIGELEASPASGGTLLQLGDTPSGVGALATGRQGGSSVGTFDVDNGETTARSPEIDLPPDAVSMSFQYYFAHLGNATSNDFFTASIVDSGGNRTTGFSVQGAASVRPASWSEASFDVSPWAGQTIQVEFSAADESTSSLVEAAVDDLAVLASSRGGSVGDSVSLQMLAFDANNDPLTFSATGLPAGLSISDSGLISGELASGGQYRPTVTVTDDGGLSASVEFAWIVDGPSQSTGTLIGDVTAGGDGVPSVNVDLFTENRAAYLASTTTDADGQFRFANLQPGCYVVTAIAPTGQEFTSGQYANRADCVQAGGEATLPAILVVTPGGADTAVGGAVVDGAGAPVSGVAADLFTADADGNRLNYERSTSTGADGTYRFDLAAAGCYSVVLIAPEGGSFRNGTGFAQRFVCVADGDEKLDQDAVLGGEAGGDAVVTGTVTDDGNPAVGVTVDLFEASGDGARGAYLRSASVDGQGEYSFEVDPDCFVVVLIAPEGRTFDSGTRYFQQGGCATEAVPLNVSAALVG